MLRPIIIGHKSISGHRHFIIEINLCEAQIRKIFQWSEYVIIIIFLLNCNKLGPNEDFHETNQTNINNANRSYYSGNKPKKDDILINKHILRPSDYIQRKNRLKRCLKKKHSSHDKIPIKSLYSHNDINYELKKSSLLTKKNKITHISTISKKKQNLKEVKISSKCKHISPKNNKNQSVEKPEIVLSPKCPSTKISFKRNKEKRKHNFYDKSLIQDQKQQKIKKSKNEITQKNSMEKLIMEITKIAKDSKLTKKKKKILIKKAINKQPLSSLYKKHNNKLCFNKKGMKADLERILEKFDISNMNEKRESGINNKYSQISKEKKGKLMSLKALYAINFMSAIGLGLLIIGVIIAISNPLALVIEILSIIGLSALFSHSIITNFFFLKNIIYKHKKYNKNTHS